MGMGRRSGLVEALLTRTWAWKIIHFKDLRDLLFAGERFAWLLVADDCGTSAG